MSSEDPLAQMAKESHQQADALAELMAGLSDEQQETIQALAAQSARVADWLCDYLSGHRE